MKARIKATGEIIEVDQCSILYDDGRRELMYGKELEEVQGAPDYWTHLEHTYAGMAMQGILGNQTYTKHLLDTSTSAKDARDIIVDASWYLAHTLVDKLKEKEEK